MTEHGSLTATPSVTPQEAILSPLLSNVTLSVLYHQFQITSYTRSQIEHTHLKRHNHPNHQLILYSYNFILLILHTHTQTEIIKKQTTNIITEQMRLTLSPKKTHITHLNNNFNYLKFHIQQLPKPNQTPITYNFPNKQTIQEIKHHIKKLNKHYKKILTAVLRTRG